MRCRQHAIPAVQLHVRWQLQPDRRDAARHYGRIRAPNGQRDPVHHRVRRSKYVDRRGQRHLEWPGRQRAARDQSRLSWDDRNNDAGHHHTSDHHTSDHHTGDHHTGHHHTSDHHTSDHHTGHHHPSDHHAGDHHTGHHHTGDHHTGDQQHVAVRAGARADR